MVARRTLRIRLIALKALQAVLLAALPLSVWWGWSRRPAHLQAETPAVALPEPAELRTARHELAWYAPLWQRDLKQVLFPQGQVEPAHSEPARPLPVLLATCVEAQSRYAHLRGADGRVLMKTINDSVDGYRVTQIESGRVELANGQSMHWVSLPKKGQPR